MSTTPVLQFDDGSQHQLQRSVVIGRSPRSAPAVVSGVADPIAIAGDVELSRHHLQIVPNGEGVSVIDLGSGNGSAVHRAGMRYPLTAMEPMGLHDGDVIEFGRQRATVVLDSANDATVIVGRNAPAPAPAPPYSSAPPPGYGPAPAPAPAPAYSAPPPAGFVAGRAEHAAGRDGFVPGRASSSPPDARSLPITNQPASFGARLVGTLLDGLLYGLAYVVLIALAIGAGFLHVVLGVVVGLGGYVFMLVYYWRQLALTGQTWGRKIAKVRIVGETTGRPIGFGKVFVRLFVAGIVSGPIFYLGYLWMLWDDKQQTWHDKAAKSVVVKVP